MLLSKNRRILAPLLLLEQDTHRYIDTDTHAWVPNPHLVFLLCLRGDARTDLNDDLGDGQHSRLLLGEDIFGLIDSSCDEKVQEGLFQKLAHVLAGSDQHFFFLDCKEKNKQATSRPHTGSALLSPAPPSSHISTLVTRTGQRSGTNGTKNQSGTSTLLLLE